MKTYLNVFISQLLIIGMAINVRTDIPFWQQFLAYLMISSILPLSMFFSNNSAKCE